MPAEVTGQEGTALPAGVGLAAAVAPLSLGGHRGAEACVPGQLLSIVTVSVPSSTPQAKTWVWKSPRPSTGPAGPGPRWLAGRVAVAALGSPGQQEAVGSKRKAGEA